MKQFFKFLFASCLGTLVALIGLTFFGVWSVNSFVKKMEQQEKVGPNTVLRIDLATYIPERTNNIPMSPYDVSLENKSIVGLQDLIEAVEVAKSDDNIKGIYLEMSRPAVGLAKLEALRRALYDFKESGKWIVAYGQYYTQNSYYLAAVADKVYLNPMGGMDFGGFSTQLAFMKEFLDKSGIKMEVFYAGKFKSATEPFRRNEMSEENRLQVRAYINGVYTQYLENISDDRKIPVSELRRISNELLLRQPEDAVTYKLVDKLAYKDEVLNELRDRIGFDKDKGIPTLSLSDYHLANGKKTNFRAKDKIAVVYAEGTIVDGEGEAGSIGGDRYAQMIRKIRQDRKVKAIVLRVNSGGGSGMASENILHEIKEAKRQGITVITSMGEAAASGGYYIACESDKIFAEENTVT
ncbi:MAG: signal peptide peptidase SppA, partial [Bacteroidota bacterium]